MPSGIRLLYVGFDVHYINPTRELLVEALSRAGNLSRFGPGYVDADTVAAGLEAYVARHGPFDVVVVDEFTVQDFSDLSGVRFANQACKFDRRLLRLGADYFAFMKRYEGRRAIALLQSDYYNFSADKLERIESVADYFITWGQELIAPRASAMPKAVRRGSINEKILERWTDRYRDYVARRAADVISIPHVIGEGEFHDGRLDRRATEWSVLGADYDSRVAARVALTDAGASRSGRALPRVFSGFSRLRINPYAHYWSIAVLQRLFRHAMVHARYGYTCGSVARMAVRKFFEIPAAGAVLVADSCEGFSELGFSDRENAVAGAGAEVMDVHLWLRDDPARAQKIADAGRRMIAERHSVSARGAQLRAALDLIAQDDFGGSSWRDGEFVLRRRSGHEEKVSFQGDVASVGGAGR